MQDRVCYLHIGSHKTGTTSIQAFLGANEERLAADGVFLPLSGRLDATNGSHHNIAWELRGHSQYDSALGGVAELVEELRSSNARTACVSSEEFELLWSTPLRFAGLCRAIRAAGWAPRVIVYLRSQAPYCVRMYAELVKHGFRTPFLQYLTDVLRAGSFTWYGLLGPSFDYLALLNFSEDTTESQAEARVYHERSPDDALLAEFARILGVGDVSRYTFPARLNQTPSFASVLQMLGLHCELDEALPFDPLTARQTAQIALRFGASNLAVARRYGIIISPVTQRELLQPLQRMAVPYRARAVATAVAALVSIAT